MKNKMSDLRNHLFETLEQLKDKDQPLDLARAQAICGVAQTIIDSAKVEVAFMKVIDASAPGSDFFGSPAEDRRLTSERPAPRVIAARSGTE